MSHLKQKKGFTLIEVLVGIFILSVVILGVYGMFDYALKVVKDKAMREEALTIANEKMEYLRSIDYNILGIAGAGYCNPSCVILATKNIIRNGTTFTVNTSVDLKDDPFDGQDPPAGTDTTGVNDYKNVEIEVQWTSMAATKSVTFASTFAPVGIETDCSTANDVGSLKINIKDAETNFLSGIGDVGVYIKNDNISYEEYKTTASGQLTLNCLKVDDNYEIIINKKANVGEPDDYQSGYSTVQTCPTGINGTPDPVNDPYDHPFCPTPSPNNSTSTPNDNPTDPHIKILKNLTEERTFFIDLLSTLNVTTVSQDMPAEWAINDTLGDGVEQTNATIGYNSGNGDMYFFWRDLNQGPGIDRVYGQEYDNAKDPQWPNPGAPAGIDVTNANNYDLPNVAIGATGDAYLVWHDTSVGNKDIYEKRLDGGSDGDNNGIPDDGETIWGGGSGTKIDTGASSGTQQNPQIALYPTENYFYVTWEDDRDDDYDIYALRMLASNGDKDWAAELPINDDSNDADQGGSKITIDSSNNLYIVWHDDRGVDYDIWAQKVNPDSSMDAGWNGGNNLQMNNDDDSYNQFNPAIALAYIDLDTTPAEYIYIVWQDGRSGTHFDIYIAKYDTNGTRVTSGNWANDIKVNSDSGTADQTEPEIAITTQDEIYVIWVDDRNGNPDIYAQQFNATDGAKQWGYDVRINDDHGTGATQGAPDLIADNAGGVIFVWHDNQSGDNDIRAATFGDANISSVSGVDLQITSNKQIGDSPKIYKFDKNFTTDGDGELKFDDIVEPLMEYGYYNFVVTGGSFPLKNSDPPLPLYLAPGITQDLILIDEN